jgi:hypothetical protein
MKTKRYDSPTWKASLSHSPAPATPHPKLKPFPNALAHTRKALRRYDRRLHTTARDANFEALINSKNNTDQDVTNFFAADEREKNAVREAFFLDTKDINSHDNCMLVDIYTLREWCKRVEDREKGLCSKCQTRLAAVLHTCPFKRDVNDDNRKCDCCQTCSQECADEI